MALHDEFEREGNQLFHYRSYLPLLLLAAALVVHLLTLLTPGDNCPWWYAYICLAVSLCGTAVRIVTVGHTPAGTSGRNTSNQVADSLNTTGMYSMVRHPLYLGNSLIYLGVAMLTGSGPFVIIALLVMWIYYERITYAEEQFLHRKFGETYAAWAAQTPAFLPGIRRYRPPAYPFSWRKVLKKEKNGVFALLLTFCVFDITGSLVDPGRNMDIVMLALATLSGLAYLVLKIIKRRTSWLDEPGR